MSSITFHNVYGPGWPGDTREAELEVNGCNCCDNIAIRIDGDQSAIIHLNLDQLRDLGRAVVDACQHLRRYHYYEGDNA